MNVFTDESLHSSKILSSKTVTLLGAFRGALGGEGEPISTFEFAFISSSLTELIIY